VSRPHCHDTVLRYAVTLQVCTRLKSVEPYFMFLNGMHGDGSTCL